MLERFSSSARVVLAGAREQAIARRSSRVEPEHVLLALVEDRGGAGTTVLRDAGVDVDAVRADLEKRAPADSPDYAPGRVAWGERGARLLDRAVAAANAHERHDVEIEDVAAALARDEGVAGDALRAAGADVGRLIRIPEDRRQVDWERFSKDSQAVVARARHEASRLRHEFVSTNHVLAALLATGDREALRVLSRLDVGEDDLGSALQALVVRGPETPGGDGSLPLGREVLTALDRAVLVAGEFCAPAVEPVHLLHGLAAEEKGLAGQVLRSLGADASRIAAALAGARVPAGGTAGARAEAKLSACIITLNEEANLPRCLESLQRVRPDEIVVLDSGSTDKTREIAAAAGARVVVEPFAGHIEQKNRALDLATHDWVLCVDADEAVSPELALEVRLVLATQPDGHGGYSVRRRNRYLGRWIRHGRLHPDRKIRLFRRDKGRWGGVNPHDKVIVEGKVGDLEGDLLHRSYRDLSHHLKTIDSFTTVMAQERARRGKRFSLFRLVFEPPARFVRMYLLQLGFLDGMPGFIAAWNAAYYVFVRHAKQYESERVTEEKPEGR